MPATARTPERKAVEPILHLAFELGATKWKLGFTTGAGRSPRERTIQARDLDALDAEIDKARGRFRLPADTPVVSCYEAGREGFWLHRYLLAQGIDNHVVDSSSIEVNRRRRRRKSDGLDVRSLLRQLCRHMGGERDVWSVVHVPSREAEDRRWLHREIETLTNERTARSNRIHSLLATHGLRLSLNSDFPARLREARLWDGSPLPPELRARLEREWVRLQTVREEIDALEAERKQRLLIQADDPALQQVRDLMKLRGIGIKSAWLFVMEFFSWREFNNRREVGGLAGLAAAPRQSGDADYSPGIEKAGNQRVRRMANEIAWSWVHHQPDSAITRWFQRRYANAGKRARRCGIVAVSRRVLVALWRYLEYGEIPDGAVLNGG